MLDVDEGIDDGETCSWCDVRTEIETLSRQRSTTKENAHSSIWRTALVQETGEKKPTEIALAL